MKKNTHIPTENKEEKSYSKKFLQRKLEEEAAEKELRQWRALMPSDYADWDDEDNL